MRKAKKTQKEEPCSRRQKLANAAGVPVRIAEVASFEEKDDDVVLALLQRLKAARDRLTPEERAEIMKKDLLDRIAFIKKKLGEKDANLLRYSDIMFNYTLAKFFSQVDE